MLATERRAALLDPDIIPVFMPVTEEDARKYDQFVLSIIKDLGCLTPLPQDSLVWHYTNGQGLLGIVQSGSLYATQISCLNDSQEIKYASGLFKSALQKLKDECNDQETTRLIDAALNYFATGDDDYSGTLPYFVACLTELDDAVSQWQGYGRGENG
jgi:hypothetical protein